MGAYQALRRELGDEAAFRRFVAEFAGLWPARVRVLAACLAAQNRAGVVAVLLSVATGSEMLGSAPLAEAARALCARARADDLAAVVAGMPAFVATGDRVAATIDRRLRRA